MPDPNQNDPNQTTPVFDPGAQVPPLIPTESDAPPVPSGLDTSAPIPDYSTPEASTVAAGTTVTEINQTSVADPSESSGLPNDSSGSAAPSDLPPMGAGTPKKKFGTGKIIATILGIFLLIGGVAGGVLLTQQNQNIAEKAGGRVKSCDDLGSPSARTSCKTNEPSVGIEQAIKIATGKVEEVKFADFCSQYGDPAKRQSCRNGGGNQDFDCPDGFVHCGAANGACRTQNGCIATGAALAADGVDDGCPEGSNNAACPGQGNCAQNTGNCFVKNGIGVSTTPGFVGQVCDGQGHWTTCENGYVCSGQDCIPTGSPNNDITVDEPTPTPTPGPTASCQNIKAYSPTFVLLTSTELSAKKAGDQVNFCVAGIASSGTFDKARFTINGVLQTETTALRPTTTDYCQLYTIPAATTAFTVSAQIHHATLDWK